MANRYWVGGTGTWDDTAGSKWALTSGGAGGQAVPTSADTVFFTNLSTGTVTIGAGTAICSTLTMTGFAGTLAFGTNSITCAGTGTIYTGATTFSVSGTPLILCTDSSATARTINATATTEARAISFNISAGSGSITTTASTNYKDLTFSGTFTGSLANTTRTIYGSLTLKTGMTLSAGVNSTTFAATSGTQTITSAGLTLDFPVTINGVGGTVTLADTFTAGTFGSWVLTNGTFNTNNQNITIASFASLNSNTRTITLGSSTINLSNNWIITTTGLTFNANTSTIVLSSSNPTFSGGGLTYSTVNFTGTTVSGGPNINNANTFTNLSFSAPSGAGYVFVVFSENQTITGTLTAGGATATNRILLYSSTAGTTRTLTSAAVSLQNVDFTDIAGAGAASPFTGTNLGNAAGNSGITFTTKTVYWNLAGAQNWSATGWATSSGGTPAAANFPLPQDTAVFDNTGSVTGTITIDQGWSLPTIDMSARTSAMTLNIPAAGTSPYIYGNWLNGSGTTIIGLGNIYFTGRNTQTITSAGKTFTQTLTIDTLGGTVQLVDALLMDVGATLTLNNGTFNASNQNVSVGAFSSSNSNTRTLTMGSGTWTISGTGLAWNTNTIIGLTFTANTANIVLSDNSSVARSFASGALNFNTLTIGGATGTSTTSFGFNGSGNPIFGTIASTKTVAHTITFFAAQTIANWTVTGTAGNVVTVNSSTVGTQRAITYTGSGTVSMDYMSIRDISFSYTLGASNPYKVYAGANSTNGGNNDGIAFINGLTQKAYRLTTGTSWTVPADWNSSNNTIYMIGAGGGGAGTSVGNASNNRIGGSGGGGGGYTVITNFSTTPSTVINYAIGGSGAGGTGGTTPSGGQGGATTWNTGAFTAGGGQGGQVTTGASPTATGGTGGTGTSAGGAGGDGVAYGTTTNAASAGGGGGSAGPNGVGGKGGNGSTTVTTAGAGTGQGGGGGNGGGVAGANGTSAANVGTGGAGGNNSGGTGGGAGGTGAAGTAGTVGGGGGGAGGLFAGGAGGAGIDIANTLGSGGGGGGNGPTSTAPTGALYGGGGGGKAIQSAGTLGNGGAGSQGVIFIIYSPAPPPTFTIGPGWVMGAGFAIS